MKSVVVALFLMVQMPVLAQIADKSTDISPLLIGEKMPSVNLIDADGKSIVSDSLFNKKPTVLIVYRGGWCPYCNVHLAEVGKNEAEIIKLGYQIVAVSPDSPKNLKDSGEKNKLGYKLLSDSKGEFCQKLGIAFKANDRSIPYIKEGSEGANETFLPVPTLMVIDKTGKIIYEYISPNIAERISSYLLMASLKALASK